MLVTGRLDEERLQAIVPDHLAPDAGEEGCFSIPFSHVMMFDDATGERVRGATR